MSLGGGSYFKGWVSNLPHTPSPGIDRNTQEVWMGHVLDVYYNELGKIRVRLVGTSLEEKDDDVQIQAYPADLNIIKYPLPGELVIITQGLRNEVTKGKFALVYYYTTTVSSNSSIVFNSDPYMGQSVPVKAAPRVYTTEYERRFEAKLKSKESFILGGQLKQVAPLQPFEGDFILQGRFGTAIRFGSTQKSGNNDWSSLGRSTEGSPILTLTARRSEGTTPVVEQINTTESSIYLCSNQTVPVVLATAAKLSSHLHAYDLTSLQNEAADSTAFLESEVHPVELSITVTGAGDGSGGGGGGGVSGSAGPQIRGKREPRQIVLHYTVGDGKAGATVRFLETKGLGIHYCIQGDGIVARGDLGDDRNLLYASNDLNTYGIGIEIATYGRLRPTDNTLKTFINDYDSKHRNKYNRDVVNFGFTWNNADWWSDYTDSQITALKQICLDTMNRYPLIKQAVVGKNLWTQVFGLDADPEYGGKYRYKKLADNKQYGIFCHNRARTGNHSDTFPSPRLVKMLKEIGMTGTYLPAKQIIRASELNNNLPPNKW